MRHWIARLAVSASLSFVGSLAGGEEILTPVIDGDWWQIAGDPDLGEYTREGQQPVDFGIDDDSKIVRSWRVAAPEIIRHEGGDTSTSVVSTRIL